MLLKYLRERQHFLDDGWAIVRDVLPKDYALQLRKIGSCAVRARPKAFIAFPTLSDSAKEFYEPEAEMLNKLLSKRRRLLKRYELLKKTQRERRGLQAPSPPATGEEIMAMVALLASQTERAPAVHEAIDATRKNIWMTSRDVEREVREGLLGEIAGNLAMEVGGVESPSLVADSPVLQEGLGAPFGFNISAPYFPVDTLRSSCVSLWVFTHRSSTEKSAVHVLRRTGGLVKRQLSVKLEKGGLALTRELETQVDSVTKQFDLGRGNLVPDVVEVSEGSILIVDPHEFVGLGPNYDTSETFALQLMVADARSSVFLQSPSWVQRWAREAVVPELSSDAFFPTLLRS